MTPFTKSCSVDSCSRKHYARGLCSMHYKRFSAHGDPLIVNPKRLLTERFWECVVQAPSPDGCWEWSGYRNRLGYGVLGVDGKTVYAHRVAWFVQHGVYPKYLLHSCDNPSCVNLAHLKEGTHRENMQDMARKGRSTRGIKHPLAKLTEARVAQARREVRRGANRQEIADRWSIKRQTLDAAICGQTWKHVPEPPIPKRVNILDAQHERWRAEGRKRYANACHYTTRSSTYHR